MCVMGLLLVLTVGTYCLISWVCPGYGLAAKQEKAGESIGGRVNRRASGQRASRRRASHYTRRARKYPKPKTKKNKKIDKKTKNHPHT